jgi:drug/metabolite transporter (DMT)-like permease
VAAAPLPPGPQAPLSAWLPRWLLLAVIWGCAFWFIKVAVRELEPLQVAFGRVSLGALVVLLVLAVTRTGLPRSRRVWIDVAVVALFLHTLPFTLFAFGETHISSVLAGIWNATTPLWAVLMGLVVLPWEKVPPERWTGLAVGFVGVLIVLGVWNGLGGGDLVGSLACISATACYGFAVTYTRRRLAPRHESPTALVGAQLLCGTVQLGLLCALFAPRAAPLSGDVVAAMAALGFLCTGLAFVLNFAIVRAAGSLASASVTYATPLVSTLVGVLLLGEALTWNQPLGALVVLAGVALVQGFVRFPRRESAPASTDLLP